MMDDEYLTDLDEEDGASSRYDDSCDDLESDTVEEFVEDNMFVDEPDYKLDADGDYSFVVMTIDQITSYMRNSIDKLNTVLRLPDITARNLLNFFKWDQEKLIEQYYGNDQEELFALAKIVNPFREPVDVQIEFSMEEECPVCCDRLPSMLMHHTICGHRFCGQCWTEYLQNKIVHEGSGYRITCAAHGCDTLLDDATILNWIADPKIRLKYQLAIIHDFVECHRLLRWCPGPDCNNVIKVESVRPRPVTCDCSYNFCFSCGESWHEPVPCLQLKKWIRTVEENSATIMWISVNTKECPKCHVNIQKMGGCNIMQCKNRSCGVSFCWLCLQVNSHQNGSCNRFTDFTSAAGEPQEKGRRYTQRYLFFHDRYSTHANSLKFESRLHAKVKTITDVVLKVKQSKSLALLDMDFMSKAVDVLCQCRRTLIYTYIFAFYLQKNNQSAIFEDNQNDLERATERLCDYLERRITPANFLEMKQEVLDKYRYCDTRRKVLLQHVQEGYEKDWWLWSDGEHKI